MLPSQSLCTRRNDGAVTCFSTSWAEGIKRLFYTAPECHPCNLNLDLWPDAATDVRKIGTSSVLWPNMTEMTDSPNENTKYTAEQLKKGAKLGIVEAGVGGTRLILKVDCSSGRFRWMRCILVDCEPPTTDSISSETEEAESVAT
jgi:hypothetical protein